MLISKFPYHCDKMLLFFRYRVAWQIIRGKLPRMVILGGESSLEEHPGVMVQECFVEKLIFYWIWNIIQFNLIYHCAQIHGNVLFAYGNIATVVAISVDRYLAVVWSARFPPSKSRTIVFIVFCWVAAIGSSSPSLFRGVSSIRYKTISHNCSPEFREDCIYYVILNVIVFVVLVPTMVLCYVGVFLKVWRQQRLLRSYADEKTSIETNLSSVTDNDDDDQDRVTHTDNDMPMDDMGQSIEGPTCSSLAPEPMDYSQSSITEEPDTEHAEGEIEENKTIQQRNVMTGIKKKDRRSMQKKLNLEKRIALTGKYFLCWNLLKFVEMFNLAQITISIWLFYHKCSKWNAKF